MNATTAHRDRSPESARACPLCGRRPDDRHRPFCSKRCAEVDLYRWLSEAYVINGRDEEEARVAGGARNGE